MDAQKLIRIYGALMWSLGKVVKTPECVRVYIGSFWDQPLQCGEWSRELLQREMADLLNDLKNVPKNAAVRKVNELVKRVRLGQGARAHHRPPQEGDALDVRQGEGAGQAAQQPGGALP